jgi:hypothetical protein
VIVYAESNFVLELVLGQEEASAAEQLLALAEAGSMQLVLPSFALFEPFSTVTYRSRERRRMANTIAAMAAQLQRSAPYQTESAQLSAAQAGLITITDREDARLRAVVSRLLATAQTVELEAGRFARANLYQGRYGLTAQDSIIYATLLADLATKPATEPKCFVTRNSKDFDDPDIAAELASNNCRLFFHFAEAVQFCTP